MGAHTHGMTYTCRPRGRALLALSVMIAALTAAAAAQEPAADAPGNPAAVAAPAGPTDPTAMACVSVHVVSNAAGAGVDTAASEHFGAKAWVVGGLLEDDGPCVFACGTIASTTPMRTRNCCHSNGRTIIFLTEAACTLDLSMGLYLRRRPQCGLLCAQLRGVCGQQAIHLL